MLSPSTQSRAKPEGEGTMTYLDSIRASEVRASHTPAQPVKSWLWFAAGVLAAVNVALYALWCFS